MEKNNTVVNLELLPPEILVLVATQLKATDLLNCELVCKSWRDLFHSNEMLWKEIAQQEFDLIVTQENFIKRAKNAAKIQNNIRRNRCISTALAVSITEQNHRAKFLLGYCSFSDKSVAVNWIRQQGHGSGQFDYGAHAALIDLKSKAVKIIQPPSEKNVVLQGPHLTQMAWNGYHVTISYSEVMHIDINEKNQVTPGPGIPVAPASMAILLNEDFNMQHLIAIPQTEANAGSPQDVFNLKITVYNLKEMKIHCGIVLKDFANRDSFYLVKPSVVFRGNKVYALHHGLTKRLFVIDINKPDEHEEIDMSVLHAKSVMTGVTETFVFGTSNATEVWCYNRKTKSLATYKEPNGVNVFDVKWYCGTLMAFESYAIEFLDLYSTGSELSLISRLVTDRIGNAQSRICEDGKIILSTIYSSVKMLDFLHVNDDVQLLSVSGNTKEDMTPHNIKAYQLPEKLTQILGTSAYMSRYIGAEGGNERYGIVFTQSKTGPKLPINTKQLDREPEYNSPYFTYAMGVSYPSTSNYTVPKTLGPIHQVVVVFYERYDGANWRLSKPKDWTDALQLLFSESKCLVQ